MDEARENPNLVEVDLRHYWDVLVRRWPYVAVTFVLVLLLTAAYTFTRPPIYRATAEILIRSDNAALKALGLPETLLGAMSDRGGLSNQIELIKSKTVLERLQKKLAADPEFMADLRKRGNNASTAIASEVEEIPVLSIESLRSALSVQQIPNTDMLRIEVTSQSPIQAASIANGLVAVFQDYDRDRARSSIQAVLQFLDQKIQETRNQLELSEQKLSEYAQQAGIALEAQALMAKLTRIEQLLADASVELEDTRSQLAMVEKFLEDVKSEFFDKLGSEEGSAFLLEVMDKLNLIRQIQREIAQWEEERAQYLKEGNYIRAQELEQKIISKRQELERQAAEQFSMLDKFPMYEELIQEQLDLTLKVIALENRVRILEAQRQRELGSLNEHGLELARLQRELDVTQNLYDLLLTEYAKTRVVEIGELGSVEVVNLADVPKAPFKPNKPLNLFVGAFLGILGGVGVAFLREALDDTFRSTEELEATLDVPVLASIPKIRHPQKRWVFEEVRELLLPHFKEGRIEQESFATLVTNLRFASPDRPLRSLLVTGPGPGVGKSVVAANLALSMGSDRGSILLLEADLRRPVLHKVFGIEVDEGVGLTEFVLGEVSLEDVLRELQYEGFRPIYFLPAGKKPPNVTEFLSSKRFSSALEELVGKFDVVILDSPPVHIASDASLLATRVDGVVLVVDASKTTKRETLAAKRMLERHKAPLLGAIFNKVPRGRAAYYGQYYYYYGHYYNREEGPQS